MKNKSFLEYFNILYYYHPKEGVFTTNLDLKDDKELLLYIRIFALFVILKEIFYKD